MKLSKLIEEIQVEFAEAKKAVKDKRPGIARACLLRIRELIDKNVRR